MDKVYIIIMSPTEPVAIHMAYNYSSHKRASTSMCQVEIKLNDNGNVTVVLTTKLWIQSFML